MSKSATMVIFIIAAAVVAVPLIGQLLKSQQAPPTAQPAPAPPPPPAPGTLGVVAYDPPNGATNVSPGKTDIRVTFSMPMDSGFSWCGNGPRFPSGPPGAKPYWTADGLTCVLPVALQANWSYEFGLNSKSFHNFRSQTGVPFPPVVYRFSTGPTGS